MQLPMSRFDMSSHTLRSLEDFGAVLATVGFVVRMITFDMAFDLPGSDKCSWTLWTLMRSFLGVQTLDMVSEMRASQELFVAYGTLMSPLIVMNAKMSR